MATEIKHPASGRRSSKAKNTYKPVKVYEISIELLHSPIKINRVITVPSDVKLDVFATIVKRAMGWGGGHLDAFTKNGIEYTDAETAAESYNYEGSFDYKKVKLNELLTRKGSTLLYQYDFGDDWQHKITLRSYRDLIDGEKRECTVVSGEGACPPDDVGGVWGYADMLYTLEHPQDDREQYEEYMDWLPEDFDPHEYNVEEENKNLRNLKV
jgi:hypothetical protein